MGRLITILLFFLSAMKGDCQLAGFNYIPLEFQNLELKWHHEINDSTIIGHQITENPTIEFDGYSHVLRNQVTSPRLITTNDFVILVSRTQYDNDIGAL